MVVPLVVHDPVGSIEETGSDNRLIGILRSIRDVNQLIMKTDDRETLLSTCVELLTRNGGFSRAWLAIIDEDELKYIHGSLMGDRINLLENLFWSGNGPPCWENLLRGRNEEGLLSLHTECSKCPVNYNSPYGTGLTRLLKNEGKLFGMISVYFPSGSNMENEFIDLFKEVSDDISFALERLEEKRVIDKKVSALRESEIRNQTLFESSPDSIFIVSEDGWIINANDMALGKYGYTIDELEGMRVDDLADPELRKNVKEMVEVAGTSRMEFEWRHMKKDGTVFPVEITSNPIMMDGKRCIIANVRDISVRKTMEESLAESERRYKSIFNNSRDLFFLYGKEMGTNNHKFIAVNNTACEVLGYSRAELLNLSPIEIIDRNQRGQFMENLKQIEDQGEQIFERTLISRDRSKIRVEINSHLIEFGKRKCFLAVARDIRPRIEAKRKLIQKEREYKALVENSPDIIIRFDRDLNIISCNNKVKDLLGSTRRRCEGSSLENLESIPLETRRWLSEKVNLVMEGEKRDDFEITISINDQKRDYHMILLPEKENHHGITSILCIARDITKMKNIQKSYKLLFEEMIDGFALQEIIIDEMGSPVDFRFLNVNKAFEELTGLSADVVIGKTLSEVLPDTEDHWIEKYGKVAITGQSDRFTGFHESLGKFFDVKVFSPRKGQFVTVFEDVTERKLLESKLIRHKNLSKFYLDLFNHDVGNIHQSMFANAEVALMNRDDITFLYSAMENQMTLILKSLRLVKNVKILSNLSSREKMCKPISMNQTIQIICSQIQEIYKDISPKIQIDLPEMEVLVNAETLVKEVFFNLIQNGIKFQCSENPRVHVIMDLEDNEEFCSIKIIDWGFGIPDNIKADIFERKKSSDRSYHTGIGLSLVKELVDRYNGTIKISNRISGNPSSGTIFEIRFPVVMQEKRRRGSDEIP
jgi:PAS domain S-box-containing protein